MTISTSEGMPLAYSPLEACKLLGCSRSWLYELLAQGGLPARKIRGRTLILHSDLLALLDNAQPAKYCRTAA